MLDILQKAAQNFENASNNNYEFAVGNRKKQVKFLITSTTPSEFIHISGLEHLTDVSLLTAKNSTQKSAIFNRIIQKQISFDDISNSKFLYSPIPSTYNYCSGAEYTIYDRLTSLSNFENIMDNAFKGEVYKWNLRKCRIKMPNGKYRQTTIKADYLFVIPTDNNNEKYYLFAYQTNKNRGKDEPIELSIFSAFPDGIDMTQGQERPYTILEEKKNGQSIFIRPSYQKDINSPIPL